MPDVLATDQTREHARELLKLEKAELHRLRELYEEARLQILGRLSEAREETFTAQHYRSVLAQVTEGLRALERRLGEHWSREMDQRLSRAVEQTLAEIAVWEPRFAGGASGQIQLDAMRRLVEPRGLLLHRFETSLQRYRLHVVDDVQRRLGLHMAMRSSWRDMAVDVAGRLRDHGIRGARYRAERIVRTELVEALSAGHDAAIEAAAEVVDGLRRQWDAHLDARTSSTCERLNGQVRPIGEPFTVGGREVARPPAHPNCRSRVVPWHARWAEGEQAMEAIA